MSDYFLDSLSELQRRLEVVNDKLMIDIYWGSNDGCFKCAISKWEFINSDKKFVYVPKIPFETIENLVGWVEELLVSNPEYLARL